MMSTNSSRPILKKKIYLYVTEFFSGMSVMAVELGASRLLAPYFSSSQIVWTIIIGTIMIAMALGNIYGGRSADKNPNPDKLYFRIVIAALWIAAIPVVGKYIILGIAGLLVITTSNGFLVTAAFLACMVLFVYPLFLLGTVTPSLAKYSVDRLEDSGKVVGTLGAYNTIGSIIGTFIPTFVTIPTVGTAITFFIFSGILLCIGIIYFVSTKTKQKTCIIGLIFFVICSVFGHSNTFSLWHKGLLYEGESIYNYLQVKEDDEKVVLSTNVLFGVQSVMMKYNNLTGLYYDYAMASLPMSGIKPNDQADVLILGMGTGTFARQSLKYYPNLSITGVEIDEKITNLSKKYFDFPDNVKTVNYDARAYLQASDKKYDVILVDAYRDITLPFQMSSKEFFAEVRNHLSDNGVMIVNMNMYSNKKNSINTYLSDTIASIFSEVYTMDVTNCSNRVLFASNHSDMKMVMKQTKQKIEDQKLRALMNNIQKNLKKYEGGKHILTDDKAPVELLGMDVIDDLISDEIGDYKDIYKKDGIKGIMKEIY